VIEPLAASLRGKLGQELVEHPEKRIDIGRIDFRVI
jgi:hypothetical protein